MARVYRQGVRRLHPCAFERRIIQFKSLESHTRSDIQKHRGKMVSPKKGLSLEPLSLVVKMGVGGDR